MRLESLPFGPPYALAIPLEARYDMVLPACSAIKESGYASMIAAERESPFLVSF